MTRTFSVLAKSRENRKMTVFLQSHLTASIQLGNLEVFKKLLDILLQKSHTGSIVGFDVLNETLHYQTDETKETLSRMAMKWAIGIQDKDIAKNLLDLEHEIHSTKDEAMICQGDNVNDALNAEYFTDIYTLSTTRRCLGAARIVICELILCSQLPVFLDFGLDCKLAFEYYQLALGNSSVSKILHEDGSNSSCNCRNAYARNTTIFEASVVEDIHQRFLVAFWVTIGLIFLTFLLYFYFTFRDGIYSWAKKTHVSRHIERQIEGSQSRKSRHKQNDTSIEGSKSRKSRQTANDSSIEHSPLERCSSIIIRWLFFIGTLLFWPVIHLVKRGQYEASDKPDRYQYKEFLDICEHTWKHVKAAEHGLESSLQLCLQLWLLKPFLPVIMSWDTTELVRRCVSGFGNFFTFETYEAFYVEKAFVKILITILTMSISITRVNLRPGLNSYNIGPLFISTLLQMIARMYALRSLVLMTTPVRYDKYIWSFFIHVMIMSAILSGPNLMQKIQKTKNTENIENTKNTENTENNENAENIENTETIKKKLSGQLPNNEMSGLCGEICPQGNIFKCNLDHRKTMECLENVGIFILRIISSIVILVHSEERGQELSFFLIRILMQLLIIIENLVLVLLPYVLQEFYPPQSQFSEENKATAVGVVVGLWCLGFIFEFVHYLLYPTMAQSRQIEVLNNW